MNIMQKNKCGGRDFCVFVCQRNNGMGRKEKEKKKFVEKEKKKKSCEKNEKELKNK